MDYFRLLGIAPSLVIDLQELQRRYYEISRRQHPDRHGGDSPANQHLATVQSADLNRAYRCLRDPIERARHWLELHGEPRREDDTRVPGALAALHFEIQEILAEWRLGSGSAAPRAVLSTMGADLDARRAALLTALHANFARWNAAPDNASAARTELRTLLIQWTYLEKLHRDVAAALGRD